MSIMQRLLPAWMQQYEQSQFRGDLTAGITVAVMFIPQGMAYAMLAGLNPINGLYAALVGLLIYAWLGTSRYLSVGPVAIDSMLVAASLSLVAESASSGYLLLAAGLAIYVGVLQFLMGVARLGYVINFLSLPVLSGFTSAAAIIICSSQINHLLGMSIPRSQFVFETGSYLMSHVLEMHPITFLFGLFSVLFLWVASQLKPGFPAAIVLVVGVTITSWLMSFSDYGVRIVGVVPSGLPAFAVPQLTAGFWVDFLPVAILVALMSFMEAIAAAKRFALQSGESVDADQELKSLGLANIGVGFFAGYPIAGSFSRTALNAQAGTTSQLSSLITAALIALTLLALTPLFFYLPTFVLAAIIVVAVSRLIDLSEARRLYRVSRNDFWVLVTAFFATLLLGVQNGILVSIVFSIIIVFQRIAHPHIALMGEIPGKTTLRNFERDPKAEPIPGLLIIRMDASLMFVNTRYFKSQMMSAIRARDEFVHAVLVDASSINEVDASAESALRLLQDELRKRGTRLMFSNLKGPVRDLFRRSGLAEQIGMENIFLSKKAAVAHYRSQAVDNGITNGK
ncbi:MAG: SulP family inorganic anion transporter [Calditrichia bacterium]